MKSESIRSSASDRAGQDVAEQIQAVRQRLLQVTTKGRELRARGSDVDTGSAASVLIRAISAVGNRLPKTGAVTLKWEEAMALLQLDEPSGERLRELQEELRKANILCAFGSHVVSFARDAG